MKIRTFRYSSRMTKDIRTTTAAPQLAPEFLGLKVAGRLTDPPTAVGTLRDWINKGKLRGYRPGRPMLVKRSELLALLGGAGS